jgi:hypothetical protein
MLQDRAFDRPAHLVQLELCHARLMQRVDQLSINIELQLRMCGVADAHGLCSLITVEPAGLPFKQSALTPYTVHDLHQRRRARHRAQ